FAQAGSAPRASNARPAEALGQGQRVAKHGSLHPAGVAAREPEPEGSTPLVGDELDCIHAPLVEQLFDEGGVTIERVVEVARLARATEAREVRSDAPTSLEHRPPIVGTRGYAMQIKDRDAVARG